MAKVSVLLGRVVHDFMQIAYFFVGFNFHCLGQEWLDFFFWVSIFSFRYPQCLHFLELLQYEHFRRELVNPACAKFIDEQQILHWQYYCRRRMRMTLPKPGQTGSEPSEQWWTQGKETKDKKKCILNSWVKTTSCKEKLNITSSTANTERCVQEQRNHFSVLTRYRPTVVSWLA